MSINPETYEVRADGELLTCEPSAQLIAQQLFSILNVNVYRIFPNAKLGIKCNVKQNLNLR